ncbi:zinc finger and SCAN domain-containing protein 5B-like [Xiphophorus maculatus]|uniref:zinc finger and SCAN domain-containing protein 5B-like n=1 Tax=Xiphophorus maculatus TaxID=8083 RepID=UPI000C6CB607|nr:zinc finger and SCAN domain-containing protein 5B-like [Xiphophorus maculatus]
MSVLSSKALQEQLSVVLGALTKAALAEICELVEEGYSVLQLEISRSHKENQDLRKKLHLIESIVVPGGGSGAGESQAPAPEEKTEATEAAVPPETPHRQRDRELEDAAGGSEGDGGSAGVEPEEVPDVVLIKDEDSDGFDSIDDGERRRHDGGAAAASEAALSARSVRRRRRRSRPYEDGDPSALKSSKLSGGSQQNVPVYSLDSPRSEPGGSAPEDVQVKTDASACSYPDVQLVQDCSLAPPGPSRQLFFSSAALMEAQSPSNRADLDLNLDPSWSKQPKGSMAFAQFCPNENLEGDVFSLKLVGIAGSADDHSAAAFEFENGSMLNFGLYGSSPGQQLSAADPDEDAHRKRFVCSICNKTYATAQNLEVHTRIHTGERPFACDQCGKKFTQSAHLRSHLNVHTGERLYGCSLCSRSFIVKYSLKLHMKKCHPNSWVQTGPTTGPKRPEPGPNWTQQLSPTGPNNRA